MEGASAPNNVNPKTAPDKSRVLDVKPMRTLIPTFPDPSQAPPFAGSSPFGQFPSGFSPFYPFNVPRQDGGFPSTPPAAAVPLRSYVAPQMGNDVVTPVMNGDQPFSYKQGSQKKTNQGSSSSQKKARKGREPLSFRFRDKAVIEGVSLSQAEQEDGNREVVNYVMMKFDAVRKMLGQLEESKEPHSRLTNHAHMRAGTILMNAGIRTNCRRRVGVAPGVEIGDIFYFRFEMCVVGLHAPTMAGIDYMVVKDGSEEETLALSIVSSGEYDDDAGDSDVLIYTGQGGNITSNHRDKIATDQKLVRGNRALDQSSRRGNGIRVIRGFKDLSNPTPTAKIYVYDGIYSIKESWIDKGVSGVSTFKYKMVRDPGQPSAVSIWQSVQKWKEGIVQRPGLILPDLTSGADTMPVSLVNDVDNEKGPPYFTYSSTIRYSKPFSLVPPSSGCNCRKECAAGDLNCACIRNNGGDCPYTGNGALVSRKPLVYECGLSCPCAPTCKNRVVQIGIKARLEVFKTKNRGWGLWSWDPIRAGTFICEYAGEVIDKAKLDRDRGGITEYIFDTSRVLDSSFKWNCDPGLVDEEASTDTNEESDLPSPLIISAKDVGNVGRFMNHSCSPTVFSQLVVTEKNGESLVRVAFFAIRHIPPLTELTYDYGISQSEHRRKRCLCGSQKCKGYFG